MKPHEKTGTEEQAKAAWDKYVEENGLPEGIPSNPEEYYADEWKGWVYFLGWTNPNSNQIELMTIKQIKTDLEKSGSVLIL